MSSPTVIETPVVVHELGTGGVLMHSMLRPELAAAGDLGEARLELELLLADYLASIRPLRRARFDLATPELRTGRVVVPNAALRGRSAIHTPIDVTCLVTPVESLPPDEPEGRGALASAQPLAAAAWVHLWLFDAAFYLRAGEDFESAVRAEVQRLARGRELAGPAYLSLLPATRTWVEQVQVPLEGSASGSALAGLRKRIDAERRSDAEALLRTIGRSFDAQPRARPLLARERELALLESLLAGAQRSGVLLLGEAGAGKSALFAGFWQARRERHAAPQVFVTSAAQLLSGMGAAGEWQARLGRVLAAAELLDAVLYIEDLHDLLLSRRGYGDDLAGYLRPWLEAGRVRIVGELRSDSLDAAERREAGFLGALTRVVVEPLPRDSARRVLEAHAAHHRKHEPHLPQLGPGALDALCELSARYLPYGVLPGAVVRLYDELRAVDRARAEDADAGAPETYAWFSVRTGVPLFLLRDDVSLRRETLQREFDRLLVGQQAAKRAVIDTLCVVKARLAPVDKPVASFLFVGPTGVGKTELARALCQVLFSDPERVVRFDMSEYRGTYAAERLIRGSERSDGLLTRKIREQPFCVLLLDEIEKAHPAVYDLLLQVLGEARLTDARGRTAYFHNTIVIMTSNLGSTARSISGFTDPHHGAAAQYLDAAREAFRPEFHNRIDRIVPFAPIARGELAAVVDLLIGRVLARRGLREAGLDVTLSPAALDALAEGSFSLEYGARGVRRALHGALVAPLSRLIALRTRTPAAYRIEVSLVSEAAHEPFDPRTMLESGVLCLRLRQRATAAHGVQAGTGELPVTRLRRRLSRWLGLRRVLELADARETLVAELAQAARRRAYAVAVAPLEARYQRLSALLEPLHAAHDEVCATEELCLHALQRGERPAAFDAELERAERSFRRALLKALVVDEPGCHAVTLLLSELDERRALDRWLPAYCAQARRLGHTLRVRLDAGGTGPRFHGPVLGAEEALDHVLAPGRTFRHVLLSAEGPEALILLGLEAGHVCYRRAGAPDVSLGVELIARFADPTEAELASGALQPRPLQALELTRRARPSRVFDGADDTLCIDGRTTLLLPASDHFARIEEVALAHLLLFEEDASLDRDAALRPAVVREAAS